MKRKVLSLLLCGVMVCSMLTACGGSDNSAESGVVITESEVAVTDEEESEEDIVETVANAETESEDNTQPTAETQDTTESSTREIYTVTTYDIATELQEFFTLWLGCNLDCALENNKTRVVDMDSMLEHGGIVGSIVENKNLHVAYEYDNSQFKGLGGTSNLIDVALGKKENVNYNTSVSIPYANFDNYSYYSETTSVLSVVANVTCYIDDEPVKFSYGSESVLFAVTLVNNKSNPEEWLITGVYYLNLSMDELTLEDIDSKAGRIWGDEGLRARDNGFNIMTELVSVDKLHNLPDWKQTYANYFLNYSGTTIDKFDIYDVNGDDIPEIFGYNREEEDFTLYYLNASDEVEEISLVKYVSILDNGKICSERRSEEELRYDDPFQSNLIYQYNDATKKFELIFEGSTVGYDLETSRCNIGGTECEADEYKRQFEEASAGEVVYSLVDLSSGGTAEIAEAILSY